MLSALYRRLSEHIEYEPVSGCYLWTKPAANGYGYISFCGRTWPVYRFFYTFVRGPPAPGLCLDHLCRNRACVNPWHLEAVSPAVNSARSHLMGRPKGSKNKSAPTPGHKPASYYKIF